MVAPKPLVLTYTMMNTYDGICPYQAFRRFIKKDIPFTETPAMRFGTEVHTALEYRIGGGKPLPLNMQQWEPIAASFDGLNPRCELKLGVTAQGQPTDFFGKDVWCRGKADLVVINGTTAYLGDHKTGSIREEPFELHVQAMMLHAANPYLTSIQGSFIWLKESRPGVVHNLSDTRITWAKVNNIAEAMRDDMQSGEWEQRRGPLCKWCPCGDCAHNTNPELAR